MPSLQHLAAVLRRLHWTRGFRAGIAVAAAMIVCVYLGQPMGWAALGGFETILVDNGGPYRSRLTTMLTVIVGGAVAGFLGAMSTAPLWVAVIVTAGFCFAITFARVLAKEIASTSVIILVIYFAGYGGLTHTLPGALENALAFVLGGLWAAALSLFLWPLDPFRPARLAVSECYVMLAEFGEGVHDTARDREDRKQQRSRMNELQRRMRLQMEAARAAIGTTGARGTARTIRARSLTVLLETADILFAGTIRWTELFETAPDRASQYAITDALGWLSRAERAIAHSLSQRPADDAASFAPEGSHTIEHVHKRTAAVRSLNAPAGSVIAHLAHDQRDALLNVAVAFEAVRALWSGVEYRTTASESDRAARRSLLSNTESDTMLRSGWRTVVDAARANWTMRSVMMRHALRMLVVGAVVVLLMRIIHVRHGSWLAMTAIIVLQPYSSGTLRRGMQRVGGTIAGGVLAAILAAALPSEAGLIVAITTTSVFTLATYAINYAWYCFFLTPTFVLMSLPQLHDWRYAGVRMGTTVLGALVAVIAMRTLWPESDNVELGRLLARGALADADYVRAMLRFWDALGMARSDADRAAADRKLLAPARRACGLAINDAEETLDRIMLEPRVTLSPGTRWEEALTFVTYLRRLTRAVTTLAVVGDPGEEMRRRAAGVAERLEALGNELHALLDEHAMALSSVTAAETTQTSAPAVETPAELQLQRMERQAGILERAAAALAVQR